MEALLGTQGNLKEISKKILAIPTFQTNFIIWNDYAQAEILAGNENEGSRIYATILGMSGKFPEKLRARASVLYSNFAQLEISRGNYPLALRKIFMRKFLLKIKKKIS